MKRFACSAFQMLAIVVVLGFAPSDAAPPDVRSAVELLAQQPPPPPPAKKSFGPSAEDGRSVVSPPPSVVLPDARAKPEAFRGRRFILSLRERRELGLTMPSMLATARELKESGEIDRDTPPAEASAAIALRLESKQPQAFNLSAPEDDERPARLQAILDLIEMFWPLIMKMLGWA